MGIFSKSKNIVFGSKAMSGAANMKGMQNSEAMKSLLSNKKVAKILDKKSEQMEFYKELKAKESGGGVTKDEIRKILGKFRSGQGKSIDKNETMGLADEIVGKGILAKRYLFERGKKTSAVTKNVSTNISTKTSSENIAAHSAPKLNLPNQSNLAQSEINLASGGDLTPVSHQLVSDVSDEVSDLGQEATMPSLEKEPESKNIVVGLIGEKGGGKGTVAAYIMDKFGATHYEVSKILVKVMESLHIEQTRENFGNMAVILKEGFGGPVLINAMLLDMDKDDAKVIIADGIRMYGDVDPFRKKYGKNFHLVYVTADVRIRYERTKVRGEKSGEANATFDQFMAEENGPTEVAIREIGKGADFRLVNNGSPEELHEQIEAMMNKILGKNLPS